VQGHLRAPAETAGWVLAQSARKACLFAARQGRLDRLRLAMRHGCKFDHSKCVSAAALVTSSAGMSKVDSVAGIIPSPLGIPSVVCVL